MHNTTITQPVFYILLVLNIKKSHGYEIMKKVSQYSQNHISLGPGTLYGALKRMLEDGLIVEEMQTKESRRRYYMISEKGKEVLSAETARLSHALSIAQQGSYLSMCRMYHGNKGSI